MERSLNKVINYKLTTTFILFTVIIVAVVVFLIFNFINTTVYNYMYSTNINLLSSTLEQFDQSVLILEDNYDRIVMALLQGIEDELSETELELSENNWTGFDQVISTAISEEVIANQLFQSNWDISFSLISPEGKTILTSSNSSPTIKQDLSELPIWRELQQLNPRRIYLQRLNYDTEKSLVRKYAYKKLAANYLLKFGITLNPDIYSQMYDVIKQLELNKVIDSLNIYSGSYDIELGYPKLADQDRAKLAELNLQDYQLFDDSKKQFPSYYLRWTPNHYDTYFYAEPYYLTVRLNFSQIYMIARTISIWVAVILFIAILTFYFMNKNISKKITVPFIELAKSMSELSDKDLSTLDERLEKTDIREVNMLLASYQEMTSELSSSFEELQAINEELEDAYLESNNLAENLNNVIQVTTRMTDSIFEEKSAFLKELFQVARRLIPEADYGSVYIVEEGEIHYIDAVGHELDKLCAVYVDLDDLVNAPLVELTEDIETEEYSDRYSYLREGFLQAKQAIKSTLTTKLTIGDQLAGGLCLDIAKGSDVSFSRHSVETIRAFGSLASAFLTMQSYNDVHEKFQREIILSIINILEIHDYYTKGHSENVARISAVIAKEMGLPPEKVKEAEYAGLVHDIGKILISKDILNKPGILTEEEYSEIQQHPLWGYDVLNNSEELRDISVYVRHHHERWDGSGYPDKLKGEEIPLISRIIALADSWDTMMSNRVYRNKLSRERSQKELLVNKGKQFAPDVVELALSLVEKKILPFK